MNVVKLRFWRDFPVRIVLLQQNFPQSLETLAIFDRYYAEAARTRSTDHHQRNDR
jgi:hypothetical protein